MSWVEQIIINFLLHLNLISIRIMLQLYSISPIICLLKIFNSTWDLNLRRVKTWLFGFSSFSKFHSSNSLTNLNTHLNTLDGDNEGRRHLYNDDQKGILIQPNSEIFGEFNNLITNNCWNVVDFSLYFVLHPLPF